MSSEDSKDFVALIEADRVDSAEMISILSAFFKANSDVIWQDALLDHGLISDR